MFWTTDGKICFLTLAMLAVHLQSAAGATAIYRSVGPGNIAPLAAGGSNALIINGSSLAVFSSGLPDCIGVGDAIQYDADNNGSIDSLAFIHSRISASVYTVKNSVGGPPTTATNIQNWAIYRAYAGLSLAATGTENTGINASLRDFDSAGKNLVAADQVWHFACYADAADTSGAVFNAFTTDADRYVRVFTPCLLTEAGASQRHAGRWTPAAYRLEVVNTIALSIAINHMRIEGLQIRIVNINADDQDAIFIGNVTNGDIRVSHNLLRGCPSAAINVHCGIVVYNPSATLTGILRAWDNVIYDFKGGAFNSGIDAEESFAYYLYNNSIHNCGYGVFFFEGTMVIKNTWAQSCTDGFSDYGGGLTSDSDYNISDLSADAPGAHSKNSTQVLFVNEADDDFHLSAADTAARDAGTDLSSDPSLPFSDDLDNELRAGFWDIGADEYYPPATPTPTLTMTPTASPTRTGSRTPTPVLSATPTATSTATRTRTPTPTVTLTRTPLPTASATVSPTATSSPTFSPTATRSATCSITATPSLLPTGTPTVTAGVPGSGAIRIYPNPFHPENAVRHTLKIEGLTPADTICIYTLTGEKVFAAQGAADGRVEWEGMNPKGSPVAAGYYFWVVERADGSVTRGKLLIR